MCPGVQIPDANFNDFECRASMGPALASTTRLDFESQTFRFHCVVKERSPGLNARSASII